MSEPIRVLQIVTQMNRAGLESRIMDIYRNIDRNQVQFDFYTCRSEKGYFDDEIISLGGKIYYSKPLLLKDLSEISKRFCDFFSAHKEYSIVHCHLNQWCGTILNGAKKANVSIRIAHSRTSLETINIKNLAKNIIKHTVNNNATHRLAVSKKAGIWLFGEKAMKKGEVEIWPNAIDLNRFKFNQLNRDEYRKKLGLRDSYTIIHVGNIRPEKNHKLLIDIFKEIKEERKNSKLMIVGADYMSGKIQKYVIEQNLSEDILFLGARSDIPELLHAADVFVFPSIYEGFPGAVLEAQGAGLPCFISETITNEVCIGKSIKQISLKESVEYWKDEIIKSSSESRINSINRINYDNYDVNSVANRYLLFYTNLANE